MDSIEQNLGKDEKVILRAERNKLAYVMPIIGIVLGSLLTLIGFILIIVIPFILFWGIIILILSIKKLMNIRKTFLVITNKRIMGRVLLGRHYKTYTLSCHIDHISIVSYKNSFFSNIFKYHTLTFSDVGGKLIKLPAVSNATEFTNTLSEAIEQHAEEAQKFQAAELANAINPQTENK